MKTQFVLSAMFVAGYVGCSSLPITKSVWSSEPQAIPQSAWTRDADSGLDWLVANDSLSLFIGVRIKDRFSQMLIRRAGLKIYLDPTGSKRDNIMVHYPYAPEPKDFHPTAPPEIQDLPVSTDLLWRSDDAQIILNPHLELTPFKAAIGMENDGVMTFMLRVPIDSLAVHTTKGTSEVSIGIDFFRPARSGRDPAVDGREPGSMPPPGGRGRPSGGMSGRGRSSENMPPQEMRTRPNGPVWFLANLARF